jgi:N-acetylglutamate synthase-like GNAT family acetyltransferase
MGKWTIRKAEHRDADALSACIDAAYAQYAARITDLPPVSANCAEEIAKYQVWVAEIENEVAGGIVIIPKEDFMRLANVAVHPDHKGAGLGRALIALAESESLDQGYREMRLTTHVDMPENVQLYAHLGWQQDLRRGNKVSMRKTI